MFSVKAAWNMDLTEPQTHALVTNLKERLEELVLWAGLTLDIEVLCQYKGQGRCRKIGVDRDTRKRYGERFKHWAVTKDSGLWLTTERK